MKKFKILPGLPGTGPYPEQFPGSKGAHREGFVVEFYTENGSNWVGNFQGGLSNYSSVYKHPDSRLVVVISKGECYIVDPESRIAKDQFGGTIIGIRELSKLKLLLLHDPRLFIALASTGILWATKEISYDGFRNLSVEDDKLLGDAWRPFGEPWHHFTVDLKNGYVTGGAFQPNE